MFVVYIYICIDSISYFSIADWVGRNSKLSPALVFCRTLDTFCTCRNWCSADIAPYSLPRKEATLPKDLNKLAALHQDKHLELQAGIEVLPLSTNSQPPSTVCWLVLASCRTNRGKKTRFDEQVLDHFQTDYPLRFKPWGVQVATKVPTAFSFWCSWRMWGRTIAAAWGEQQRRGTDWRNLFQGRYLVSIII